MGILGESIGVLVNLSCHVQISNLCCTALNHRPMRICMACRDKMFKRHFTNLFLIVIFNEILKPKIMKSLIHFVLWSRNLCLGL